MEKKNDLTHFKKLSYNLEVKKMNDKFVLTIPELLLVIKDENLEKAYKQIETEKNNYFEEMFKLGIEDEIIKPKKMSSQHSTVTTNIKNEIKLFLMKFVLSLLMVGIIGVIAFSALGPIISKATKKDVNKIRVLGLLTHNPEVHYKLASIFSKRKDVTNIKRAINEIFLALGLIKPDKTKYIKMLEELIRKLPEEDKEKAEFNLRLKEFQYQKGSAKKEKIK